MSNEFAMKNKHVLVLDEGTTSTRAVLFDQKSQVITSSARPLEISTFADGRVEQDAEELWRRSQEVISEVITYAREHNFDVSGLGIAAQRTTTVFWDGATGQAIAPVVSWQDTRAAKKVESLGKEWLDKTAHTTGMVLGAANVALHAWWMLNNNTAVQERAETETLRIGTVDAWLIWKLTGGTNGGNFVTSASCAGSSGAANLRTMEWWDELLDHLDIPVDSMPEVLAEDADYGLTETEIVGAVLPITGILGDQQSALYGQGGFEPGSVKCTHGTGSFIDFNVGKEPIVAGTGLDCRVGWETNGQRFYILEGGSFVTGSGVDWLVNNIGVLENVTELDRVYSAGDPDSGLVCVPALAGFAAPYWDSNARGLMIGFNRGTTSADIVRATVDGIVHTVADILEAMAESSGTRAQVMWVDGGLGRSDALLQAQADLTNTRVVRAAGSEYVTARGAAWCAGIATGVWADEEEARNTKVEGTTFDPRITDVERDLRRRTWKDAVGRALGWKRLTRMNQKLAERKPR